MAEAVRTSPKKTVRSHDFRLVFCNAMRLRVGDNDGAITFVVETDDEHGTVVHEDQVQVVMTPRTMKILQFLLTHAITELERVMGPITLAPEKIKELENSIKTRQPAPNT